MKRPVGFLIAATVACMLVTGCSSPPPLLEWRHTGGPTAQNIAAVLPDRDVPGRILAGQTNGEISLSTDDGRTWSTLASLPERPFIHALFHHPEMPRRIYAATRAGLMVSVDGGTTWTGITVAGGNRPSPACRVVAFDAFDPQTMYAGADGFGVFTSSDGGTTWSRSFPSATDSLPGEVYDIATSRANPNRLYAALKGAGLVTSSDRGETWTRLTAHLAASGTIPVGVLPHPRREELLCFGTLAGDIYRTTDGGGRWLSTRQGNGAAPVNALWSGPGGPEGISAAVESGIITSSDFGLTWYEFSPAFPPTPCRALLRISGSTSTLYAFGEGAGLQRTTDEGKSWEQIDHGLGGSTVSLLTADPRTGTLYAAAGSAIFEFQKTPGLWASASRGLFGGTVSSITFAAGDSTMYAGTPVGIFRSKNAGGAWWGMPRTFGPFGADYVDAHMFFRTRMLVATSAGILASTDRGASWKPSNPRGVPYAVRTFTYAPGDAGVMHAATRNRGVIGTTDGGLTWESNRYGIREDDVLAVARDRENPRVLFCWTATGEGYRSSNNGMEWERYAPAWKPGDHVMISVDRKAPHLAAALVNLHRISITSDAGATWRTFETARLDADVLALFWQPSQHQLFAGTRDRGVYRLDLVPVLGPPLNPSP